MPFSRPTRTELRQQVSADVGASLPGADALLRRSVVGVLSTAQADLAYGHYGYLDWIARQAVPATSTDEFLEQWAALKGVTRKPATAATGQATFTGANGSVLPAGTNAVRGDGAVYVVQANVTVSGGVAVATLQAAIAGAAGNAASGVLLTLVAPVTGVTSAGAASSDLTGGSDVEADDSFRGRMLQVYSAPPQGGARIDYVEWAEAVAGVTRAWVKPLGMGAGTVVVYVMLDLAEAAFSGLPQGSDGVAALEARDTAATGDQLAVANYLFNLQPVEALIYVVSPQFNVVTFTIAGISGASAGVKQSISDAIDDIMLREGSPGGVVAGDGTPGGTLNLSLVEAAIAGLAGTSGFVITAESCTHGSISPTIGNITSNAGYLPVRGAITYV